MHDASPVKKKHDRAWGRRGMRYPASEKREIIRIVRGFISMAKSLLAVPQHDANLHRPRGDLDCCP